ncbi:Hypothetical protein, putative [Bodo saltans]|uniref:COMM domain-containing protein n=1 Tax=Bodo saltans TaxID=75058 RepID=A0A0S4IHQ1_BODSA|nr:Hypothetical protein, putative [Bodo saltans]|eukprot:CUE67281.1 Hypothetical protein, putative [Bodo saltans]
MSTSDGEVFYSIDWRLEAPIAARRYHPTSTSTTSEAGGLQQQQQEHHHAPLAAPTFAVQLTTQREDGSLRTRWFSCDYETLHNISKGLEDAAAALRSPAYRRIHKMVK